MKREIRQRRKSVRGDGVGSAKKQTSERGGCRAKTEEPSAERKTGTRGIYSNFMKSKG